MASSERVKKYKSLIRSLLPSGKAWSFGNASIADKVFEAIATEFCRVEERVNDLLFEADPRQSIELLEEWERLVGLPDECSPEVENEIERRQLVLQRLTQIGALNGDFYEFIGQQLGFDITVTDVKAFRAGFARAGDRCFTYKTTAFAAGSTAGQVLVKYGWRFFFLVDLPATAADIFRAGDTAGDRLREFENPLIECTIKKLKPAHAGVTFIFSEVS